MRTLGSRRLRQLRPKGATLGLNEGYHVETARSGGPITPKRCDFRGSGFVLLPGLRSLRVGSYMYIVHVHAWQPNCAYCARLGMTGNSILAPNLSQGNAGTDWGQMKTSGIWGLPNVRNTHSSASTTYIQY